MAPPKKKANENTVCIVDPGSTQKLIFGPVGLQVILQHFLEGFFENVIFSYFFSPVLVGTYRFFKIRNPKMFVYFSENHENTKNLLRSSYLVQMTFM